MRRWRRTIRGVAIYGLIGLVVNVLVAWGFAAWGAAEDFGGGWNAGGMPTSFVGSDSHVAVLDWSIANPGPRGAVTVRWVRTGPGMHVLTETDMQPDPNSRGIAVLHRVRVGWPCLALQWHEMRFHRADSYMNIGLQARFPAWLPVRSNGGYGGEWIPLRPVWPGLVVNSVVYAVACCGVVAGLFALRRAGRRQRGLCPRCAYDLRGDMAGGCPECGWGRASSHPT